MHANNNGESCAESGDDLIIHAIGFQRAADVTPLRFSHTLQTLFVVAASDLDFRWARPDARLAAAASLEAAAGLLVLQRVLEPGSLAWICSFPSESGHRAGDLYAAGLELS